MKLLVAKDMVPEQATINITFVSAIYGGLDILEWMLSLPVGKGKPNQDAIDEAYHNAKGSDNTAISSLLKRYSSAFV